MASSVKNLLKPKCVFQLTAAPPQLSVMQRCECAVYNQLPLTITLLPLIIHLQLYADLNFSPGKMEVNKQFSKRKAPPTSHPPPRTSEVVRSLKNNIVLSELPRANPASQCL